MANLQAATLTIPTNVEGTVTPVTYDLKDATARAGVSATVDLMKDTTGWLGKNKLPNTAVSRTNRGVDFTVNTNKSITANGTNDGSDQYGSDIYVFGNNARGQRKKVSDYLDNSFVFSAGIEVPSTMNVAIWFYDSSENYLTTIGIPTGAKEVEVTVPNNAVYFLPYVRVYKDQTVDNVTVYPMICSKEEYDLSPTYEPYHESVEEMLAYSSELLTTENTNIAIDTGAIYKWGRVVNLFLMFKCTTTTPNTDEVLFTLPAKYRPSTTRIFRTYDVGTSATSERHQITIDSSGVCTLKILDTHDAGRWIRFEETFISAS